MPLLETIRTAIPETARVRLYTYVAAGVLLLSGLGYVADSVASLWSAVGISSVTLAFALLHSTSPWRTALYGFLVALAPLALWYSIGTATGWAAVLGFAATVFGITKAASNTITTAVPVVIDESGNVFVGDRPDSVATQISDGFTAGVSRISDAERAMAVGVRPGPDLERYLELIADTASVAGVQSGEVSSIFNKIQAQGTTYNIDLLQLEPLGLPVRQWLAKEVDVAVEELPNVVGAGQVDAATFLRAVERNIGGAAKHRAEN